MKVDVGRRLSNPDGRGDVGEWGFSYPDGSDMEDLVSRRHRRVSNSGGSDVEDLVTP